MNSSIYIVSVLLVLSIGSVSVASFTPGTVMWTQVSYQQWFTVFVSGNSSRYVQVPFPGNCGNCLTFTAVDSNRHIFYVMPSQFSSTNYTLAAISYGESQARVQSICTFEAARKGLPYAAAPYALVTNNDGILFALLHSPFNSTGLMLAKVNPTNCDWSLVDPSAPTLAYVPLTTSIRPTSAYLMPELNQMAYMGTTNNQDPYAVTVDLATGKLVSAIACPRMQLDLPIVTFAMDGNGWGYLITQAYGPLNQYLVVDFTGKNKTQIFYPNAQARSYSSDLLLDSRPFSNTVPGPLIIDYLRNTYIWKADFSSPDAVKVTMLDAIRGSKGDWPGTAAVLGSRYDEKLSF